MSRTITVSDVLTALHPAGKPNDSGIESCAKQNIQHFAVQSQLHPTKYRSLTIAKPAGGSNYQTDSAMTALQTAVPFWLVCLG